MDDYSASCNIEEYQKTDDDKEILESQDEIVPERSEINEIENNKEIAHGKTEIIEEILGGFVG